MTNEQKYVKLSQLEHILLRPDTYVGSLEKTTEKQWVYDDDKEKFIYKEITYTPGLYKIFDEILVNAVDNYQRDKSQKYIKVEVNKSKNQISICNDGQGIPIEVHKEHKCYIPELIFGHLLTSSSYNDNEKKIIGGRNGFGAKLTNIFSTKFIVETVDSKNKKSYRQEFSNNMKNKSEPEIKTLTSNDSKSNYTKITFEPDLKKFHMKNLEDDIISLFKKRVYDMAGTTPYSLKVYYNSKEISNIKSFEEYVELYLKDEMFNKEQDIEYPKIFDFPNERWEVMITMSDSFQHVSFVNNICTYKGGSHVNHVIDQIITRIIEYIKKKNKGISIKPAQVKNHLSLFLNCKIENPCFDSQTKENMTLKQEKFGSSCDLTEKFYNKIFKSKIIDNIVCNVKAKETIKLNKALSSNVKKTSRLLGIPKLEDANNAGTKLSNHCTLILTEGDSAKALALAGLEVVGRENYGVYPLKGKLLNVRDTTNEKLTKNEEIQSIIKIIGLQLGKTYDNLNTLRYGRIMIMADQDPDGSHIKGLIINFIDYFWPSLIKSNNFLYEFITPIVKVFLSGDKHLSFYSQRDFKDYYSKIQIDKVTSIDKLKIKYYKGLGTSTAKEAKEYFRNFTNNFISFQYKTDIDREKIDLVFNKSKANERKAWLSEMKYSESIQYSTKCILYSEFIDKELIIFSNLDNYRSIPSISDGLKPSERKILYSCFKRKLNSELKVAQLAGYVAEHSEYHHGEQSLCMTITAMAQDFIGSNNFNLLYPIGQFGNRYHGGKGAASPRYIYTQLNKLTRLLFKESDDNLLNYLVEDGQKIEPLYYFPILPLLLINGADGIGTGWSTSIPSFNPIDIARNIINKLYDKSDFVEMTPWYRGFKGEIVSIGSEKKLDEEEKVNLSYMLKGVHSLISEDNSIEITELPVKTTISAYKEFLESNYIDSKENKKNELEIVDIKEYHSENLVNFRVYLTEDSYYKLENMDKNEQLKTLKLTSTVTMTNLVAFDYNNKIKKYSSPIEILSDFYTYRLSLYAERKKYLLKKLYYQYDITNNKHNFINLILNGEILFLNKSKKEIIKAIQDKGLLSEIQIEKKHNYSKHSNTIDIVTNQNETKHEEDEEDDKEKDKDYDYLMSMNMWNLSKEKVGVLKEQLMQLKKEINELSNITEKDMWRNDIEQYIKEYENVLLTSFKNSDDKVRNASNDMKHKSKIRNKNIKLKKIKKENEDENEDEESELSSESFTVVKKKGKDKEIMNKSLSKEKEVLGKKRKDNKTDKNDLKKNHEINESENECEKSKIIKEEEYYKMALKERLKLKQEPEKIKIERSNKKRVIEDSDNE